MKLNVNVSLFNIYWHQYCQKGMSFSLHDYEPTWLRNCSIWYTSWISPWSSNFSWFRSRWRAARGHVNMWHDRQEPRSNRYSFWTNEMNENYFHENNLGTFARQCFLVEKPKNSGPLNQSGMIVLKWFSLSNDGKINWGFMKHFLFNKNQLTAEHIQLIISLTGSVISVMCGCTQSPVAATLCQN